MMKKFIYAVLTFGPLSALAQTTDLHNVTGLIGNIGKIFNQVIPVIFALAIVYFFWGLITFLRAAGDVKMLDQGKSHMIYGIIAIAVMLSVYGLVGWLQGTLGINPGGTIVVPTVPGL